MLVEDHITYPGLRSVGVREVQKSLAQSVKRLIEDKIDKLGVRPMFDIKESEIRTPGDGLIIFQGMQNHTADSIKSLEGFRRAWVEEAHSLSGRSLELLRPTLRADATPDLPGSEMWFSWNPDKPTDPVDELLRGEVRPPDSVVVEVNYEDNPWFPAVLREEMEYDKRRNPEKYLHVWRGAYQTNSEARVFKNWTVEEFERPKGTIFRLGADWGFSVDPSVLLRASIEGRRLYIDYEAYMVGCEIDQLPDLFDRVPESRKWFITADSSRPETISYMQRHGYPKISKAIKGPGSIAEGIQFLQSYDIVVHPRCTHVIDELTHYSFKKDPLTGEVLPIFEDKKNHLIDALRYACEAVRKASETEFKIPANTTRTIGDRVAGY